MQLVCIMLHILDVTRRLRTLTALTFLETVARNNGTDDRLRAAEALARSEERLRLAIEATALGTFEWDIARDRLQCSPNVKTLFGLHGDNSLSIDSVISRIHPEDQAAVRAAIDTALAAGGPHNFAGEFRTLLPDGASSWIDARGAALFGNFNTRPQCVIGIVLDISERKARELMLRRSAADLETANHLKNEFLGTLAQRLRNPLTPLSNGLEILARAGFPDPSQRWAYDLMGRQLRHLMYLVDELLDASQVICGRMTLDKRLVSIQRIIERALELVRPRLQELPRSVILDIPARPLIIEVDPVRIAQALANVLDNSVAHTDPNGRICVRVRPNSDGVAVEVQDSGPGVSPQMSRDALQLFVAKPETDGCRKGLGIGLALTRALVEMHGGAVAIANNRSGNGANVRMWLPALPVANPAPANSEPASTLARQRILIIDPDVERAECALKLLRRMDQDARHAPDMHSAEQLVREFRPAVIFAEQPFAGAGSVPTFSFPAEGDELRRILSSLREPAPQTPFCAR